GRSDGKHGVGAGGPGGQINLFTTAGEPRSGNLHFIAARRETSKVELAGRVGVHRARVTTGQTAQVHAGARNHGAGRIGNGAGDFRQRGRRRAEQGQRRGRVQKG